MLENKQIKMFVFEMIVDEYKRTGTLLSKNNQNLHNKFPF